MHHFIGADDRDRAARLYARETHIHGATRTLADHVLAGERHAPNPGLEWAVSLLRVPGLSPQEVHWLCNQYQFDLLSAVENRATLGTRYSLLLPVCDSLQRLSERDPGNTLWQRDLSVSCWKIGEMMEAEESEEANAWWRRAHDKLAELKAEGRLAPMDEQYLAWLRQKIGR